MRMGIMQPYFFPYLGYFDLINRVNKWVVFDIVDYANRSWMNRNRVLHPANGWQYITVPVDKASCRGKIFDVTLVDKHLSQETIISQLGHYKKSAPFYRETVELIKESFDLSKTDKLVDLNVAALDSICRYLGIKFNFSICSQLDLNLPEKCHPGQWALEISDILCASEYYNPCGGIDLFDPNEFKRRNISLKIINSPEFKYQCIKFSYEPYMSIVDVLMWNQSEQIKLHLDESKMLFHT